MRLLDVRDLPAPEPLTQILSNLQSLSAGEYLVVYHRQEPCALFPKVSSIGFSHRVVALREGFCEILFWREGDLVATRCVNGHQSMHAKDDE